MQIVINKPKNIPALAKLNEPTMRNGKSAIKTGMVLNTHAQRGKPVAPENTATNKVTANARNKKIFITVPGIRPPLNLLCDIIISLFNQKIKRLALANLEQRIIFIVFSQKT